MKFDQTVLNRIGIKLELFLVLESHKQVGNIYISSYFSAMQPDLVKKNKIKSILTIAKGCRIQHEQQSIPYYLYLPIEDKKNIEISKYFNKCFQFIDYSRERTNILIHCKAGVSRSVSVVIAYLMYKFQFNLVQAYLIMKKANPKIKPNAGFIEQLKQYNKQLNRAEVEYDQKNNEFYLVNLNKVATQKQQDMDKQLMKQKMSQLAKQKQMIHIHIKQIKSLIQQNTARNQQMSQTLKQKINYFQRKKKI